MNSGKYLEGRMSADEHVEDDAKRPNVNSWCIIAVTQENFGC